MAVTARPGRCAEIRETAGPKRSDWKAPNDSDHGPAGSKNRDALLGTRATYGHMPSLVRAHWRETNQLDRCAAHTLDQSTETNSGGGREALWHSHLDSSEIVTTRIVFTTCQVRGDCAQHLCLRVLCQCESSANPMRNQCETPVRNPPRMVNYSNFVLEGEKHK